MPPEPQPVPAGENIREIQLEGKRVHLVGTAHISARSVQEVTEVIDRVQPDTVCVELCAARLQSLMHPDAWREMDLFQVVRQKRATVLLANLILASFQRRLGEKLGVKPGAEMVAAVERAEAIGAELVLADREIQITLRRTWGQLRWWDKFKLAVQLPLSLVAAPALSEEDVEKLKTQDMLSQVMEEFARAFPRAKAALIDERDRYMAHKIRQAPGETVVAVVGAGHLKGIVERIHEPTTDADMEPLREIPRKAPYTRAIQWAIPALVIGLIAYGFTTSDAEVSWEMVKIWFVANGLLAGLGAALAFAHPLTILTAVLAAPLTSLNPMVAAGWVAGLAQAFARKPKVRDFESLPTDITSLRGFWSNSVTRILLVVALANLGSTLGTFISIPLMTALLG
ncbi:MAG: TraB/GumN family protein [SAR324 cluster bacterium]|nr:TraB/GumN family protein [SAR324 cluster bacterium]